MDFEKTKKEMQDIISKVSEELGKKIDISKLEFVFEEKGSPISPSKKNYMYVYSFWHDDYTEPLKIGKASKNNSSRFRVNHYIPSSSKSNLALSLINDNETSKRYGLNEENVGKWMLDNLHRLNIRVPFDVDNGFDYFTLELIEVILHYKYEPYFEGCKSQRAKKDIV